MIQISGVFGGGSALPDEIVAGDTVVLALNYYSGKTTNTNWGYPNVPSAGNKQIKIKKNGTYRFRYDVHPSSSGITAYINLTKNGSDVSGGDVSSIVYAGTTKTIDLALSANDIIRVALRISDASYIARNNYLVVSVLATDLQGAINTVVERQT